MNNDFEKFLLDTNLVNAKSLDELYEKERDLSIVKYAILKQNPIRGKFDFNHLKMIHKELFCDIYSWAGKDRSFTNPNQTFYKGQTPFVPSDKIEYFQKIIFDDLKKKDFLTKIETRREFIEEFSDLFANLNALHPFREGNGRVQRLFMEQVAKNAGYKIDLGLINRNEYIKASIYSSYPKLNNLFLRNMFNEYLIKIEKQNITKDSESIFKRLDEKINQILKNKKSDKKEIKNNNIKYYKK